MLSKCSSSDFLFDFDVAKFVLSPPLVAKDMGFLFQGPYMLILSPTGAEYGPRLY